MSDDEERLSDMSESEDVPASDKTEGDICGDGSVMKTIVKEGTGLGKPKRGAKVEVHYVGTLPDGTEFDSSRGRGEPFTFDLGSGVIQGWSDGVATMKKGEIANFIMKPNKAYGAHGSPPKIPPNATLHFEIELLDWTSEEDVSKNRDKSVMKTLLLVSPRGYKKPSDLCSATARVKITLGDGKVVLDRTAEPLTFIVDDDEVISGLSAAVRSMRELEKASFRMAPQAAYGAAGSAELGVPANAEVTAEVELVSFTREKDSYEMSFPERMEAMAAWRAQGNDFFKKGDIPRAARRYAKALALVEHESSINGDADKKTARAEKAVVLTNAAACDMKLRDWKAAIDHCDKALAIDAASAKALYRRGAALLELGEWARSRKDIEAVLASDPTNAAALDTLKRIKAAIAAQDAKDKKKYAGMFEKMAKAEAREHAAAVAAGLIPATKPAAHDGCGCGHEHHSHDAEKAPAGIAGAATDDATAAVAPMDTTADASAAPAAAAPAATGAAVADATSTSTDA